MKSNKMKSVMKTKKMKTVMKMMKRKTVMMKTNDMQIVQECNTVTFQSVSVLLSPSSRMLLQTVLMRSTYPTIYRIYCCLCLLLKGIV